jgi:O-methyltransferase
MVLTLIKNLFKFKINDDSSHEVSHPLDIAIKQSVYNNFIGSYLEFGVNKGNSFIRSYKSFEKYINHYNKKYTANLKIPKFYAFDAFEDGVPDSQIAEDKDIPFHWKKDLWIYKKENFIKNCLKKKINLENVIIEKGLFSKTLLNSNKNIGFASVIFFDCDFKEPTTQALHFCKKHLDIGTILVFDDFFRFKGNEKKGPYAAFQEFMEEGSFKFREFQMFRGQIASFICSSKK